MFDNIKLSLGQMLNRQRGKAPKGKRWLSSSVYFPAGRWMNVRGTFVKNPKIAADINARHNAWAAKKGVPA